MCVGFMSILVQLTRKLVSLYSAAIGVTGVPFYGTRSFHSPCIRFFIFLSFADVGRAFFCKQKGLDSVCHRGKKLFDFLFESVELGSTEKLAQSDF